MKKLIFILFTLSLFAGRVYAQSLDASGHNTGAVPIDFNTIDFSNTYNTTTKAFAIQAHIKNQWSWDPQIVFVHVDIVGYDGNGNPDSQFPTYYAALSYPDSGVLPANKTYDSATDGDAPGVIIVPPTTVRIVYTFSVVTTTNSNSGYSQYQYEVFPY